MAYRLTQAAQAVGATTVPAVTHHSFAGAALAEIRRCRLGKVLFYQMTLIDASRRRLQFGTGRLSKPHSIREQMDRTEPRRTDSTLLKVTDRPHAHRRQSR